MQATKRFRERLREAMDRAGLTQRELAVKTKTGYPGINRILQGKQTPTIELADRLADAIGVPLSELFSEK